MEDDAVSFVQTAQMFAHLRSEDSLHRHGTGTRPYLMPGRTDDVIGGSV
jgi:hypothetical protein